MKLNRNVALRELDGGIVYLENQVTHLRAWLSGDDAQMVKNLPCECPEGSKTAETLCRLWFVDRDESDCSRDFSYQRKQEAEALEKIENPWETPLYRGETPWLNNLQIELTDACNERCIHCYMPEALKRRSEEMSREMLEDLLRQYRAMNGLKVVFSGGEIFLRKDLWEILELCRDLGLFVLLQTNMLILTDAMLEQLRALRVFNIQVSLYSTDPEIHDAITTVKGSCRRTMANIERLVRADIPVMIACPVMKQNLTTVGAVKDYAAGLGVEVYYDYIMMAQSDGATANLDHRISLSDTRDMIDFLLDNKPEFLRAIEEAKDLGELLKKQFVRRRTVCRILSSGLCVAPDGTAYPCPGWKDLAMGSVAQMPLAEIWGKSEKTRELRAVDMESDFEKCRGCDLRNFCDMCAVYNYNEHGDMLEVCSRFCEAAAIFRQAVTDKYNRR